MISIQKCVDDYIKTNKKSTKLNFEIKEDLKKVLKEKCGYKFDIRTIRGKEIFQEVLDGINKED